MYYSPLRYPGGKSKLSPFIKLLIEKSGHLGGTYIEPFAGGAGIALELLLNGDVSEIVINDLDKGIYSFWRAIIERPNRFVNDIFTVPLTIDEWEHQRSIYYKQSQKYSYELGFATFYLNRTNRSGIIKGGVIGGQEQSGKWHMDVRFNRQALAEKVLNISKHSSKIHLYNKDICSFLTTYAPKYYKNAFIYFDPPYYEKGPKLYMNFLKYKDHVRIRDKIDELSDIDWVITYDNCSAILELYKGQVCKKIECVYSVATKRTEKEIIIFKDASMIPTDDEIKQKNIHATLSEVDN